MTTNFHELGQPVSLSLTELVPSLIKVYNQFGDGNGSGQGADALDFASGNPHEPPLVELVESIRRWTIPRTPDWFRYRPRYDKACEAAAAALRSRNGLEVSHDKIFLTTGSFGGLAVALRAVVDHGDEVLFAQPCWHFYESLIRYAGAQPVTVSLRPPRFDFKIDELRKGLSDRTRVVVVNTPNNPTGRVYEGPTLSAMSDLLLEHSIKVGRPIYIISDESYSRLIFDSARFESPASYYPFSIVLYTFGKTLLVPGLRLGYLALGPGMPNSELVGMAITIVQTAAGYAYPDTILQYALADLEKLSIDVGHLEQKRNRLISALKTAGYEIETPEGGFWCLARAPVSDDMLFAQTLAAKGLHVTPGSMVGAPGYFRMSLTPTDEMIERAIPIFQQAINSYRHGVL